MKTKFKIRKITDLKNGYDMPIVEVESNTDIEVVNRGWNEFQCLQEIDESELLPLRDHFPTEETVMLEIYTPSRNTVCWYNLRNRNGYPLKDTGNLQF